MPRKQGTAHARRGSSSLKSTKTPQPLTVVGGVFGKCDFVLELKRALAKNRAAVCVRLVLGKGGASSKYNIAVGT